MAVVLILTVSITLANCVECVLMAVENCTHEHAISWADAHCGQTSCSILLWFAWYMATADWLSMYWAR